MRFEILHDYSDFSSEEATGVGDHQNAVVSAGEIVLLGLNIVVPLIDAEILKVQFFLSNDTFS